MASFRCGLFLFNTKGTAQRLKAAGNRDADLLLQELLHHHKIFAAHSLYFENNPWSPMAGRLYLTVQVNMGPQIRSLPSRLRLDSDIS